MKHTQCRWPNSASTVVSVINSSLLTLISQSFTVHDPRFFKETSSCHWQYYSKQVTGYPIGKLLMQNNNKIINLLV